jgi:hypothetical protein
VQRQTLASTTGAAIIENGKITKPVRKKEVKCLDATAFCFIQLIRMPNEKLAGVVEKS